MTGLHRLAGLLTVVALAVPLAACAAAAPGGGNGSGDAVGAAPTGATSPTAGAGSGSDAGSGTTSESGSGSGSTGTGECLLANLSVTAGGTDAASGHRSLAVVFTNRGPKVCSMRGYPGIAALDSHNAQVAQAVRKINGYMGGLPSGASAPTVNLSVGESASALVEAMAANSDGSSCVGYTGLLVTPPDETHTIKVVWKTDSCSGLQVHPVVLGITGRE